MVHGKRSAKLHADFRRPVKKKNRKSTPPSVDFSPSTDGVLFFTPLLPIIKAERRDNVDQIKIGKFIAERRKKANLTQAQLAEKLNITDRAISKWETGKAMPDSSIMLELCGILNISVNDLLHGEMINVNNYNSELENKLVEMLKEKEESDRRLLRLEWVVGILSCIILFAPIFIAAYAPIKDWQRALLILSGFIPGLVGLGFAIRIEQTAGYYECAVCKHKYVPTYKAVTLAPHYGRTRKMKCPACGKKTWQKKVTGKE